MLQTVGGFSRIGGATQQSRVNALRDQEYRSRYITSDAVFFLSVFSFKLSREVVANEHNVAYNLGKTICIFSFN